MGDSGSLREDGVVTGSGLREERRLDTCPAVQTEVRTPWACTDLSIKKKARLWSQSQGDNCAGRQTRGQEGALMARTVLQTMAD